MTVFQFEWDKGNQNKNVVKHGVSCTEVEEIFYHRFVLRRAPYLVKEEMRYLCYGGTKKARRLTVVFTIRSGKIRVISARAMSRKERRFYDEEKETAPTL